MKDLKFILGVLLVIFISVIHIHFSLYTIDNLLNPVTFVSLFMKGEDTYMFFTGYSVQFLITLLAAYFILRFRHMKIWLIVYIIGAFAAFWIEKYSPLSYLPIFQDSAISAYYGEFYRYGREAFMLGVYYVVLQLLVLILYMFFVSFLKIPIIGHAYNTVVDFVHHKYNISIHSKVCEKMCRNRYTLGTVILVIILFYMIMYILS